MVRLEGSQISLQNPKCAGDVNEAITSVILTGKRRNWLKNTVASSIGVPLAPLKSKNSRIAGHFHLHAG